MTSEDVTILVVLILLEVKHFLADFVFQRPYSFFRNKGTYGHIGGIVHAGIHILGTVPALLVAGPPAWAWAAILIGEFVIHYHLDWGKEQIDRRPGWSQSAHFLLLGLDQLGHQLTYIAILAIIMVST